MVMMALPTTTNGLRARSERLGGGGTCSGSSAARGLRGEMGGLSLIDQPESCRFHRGLARLSRKRPVLYAQPNESSPNTAKRWIRKAPQLVTRRMITEALVPPKPNELDSATLISRLRGVCGTRSIAVCTDGCSKLMVGGAMLSRIAKILKIASIAPAAPNRCPVDDLVDDIETFEAALPRSRSTALSSISSPTCVEVPCALI